MSERGWDFGAFMDIYEFDEVIHESGRGGGAYVRFPYDIMETFGAKGRVKIACEFDGVPYRGSIVNMGTGPIIGVLKSIRDKTGKQAGDTVHVKLWKDEEPREVSLPAELEAALGENEQAKKNFDALSFSHRREYACWIAGAKKEETKKNRIEKAINMLEQGKKSPSK
ncbi:MAG: YdeI/OmpD-associated family protein [Burkholderiales bacterium]